MRKIIFLVWLLALLPKHLSASVDFGATWTTPQDILPACLGNQYVEVGFFVNWEVNNDYFQIVRSTDPNFSSSIVVGIIDGCGTCGNGMYTLNDYGPFGPNEVWYYKANAISNWNGVQVKNLGTYTTNIPTTVNWINQVTHSVVTGSSPSTEASYIWAQENRDGQGVGISLMSTEIAKIYLEQGNNKIRFYVQAGTPFVAIDVNVDNGGYSNIYNGSAQTGFTWNNSSGSIYNLGAHNLKVKFTATNATQYVREYEVYVVPKSDAFYQDNLCNTMRVWKTQATNNPTPLILSEGYDAYNTKSEQYYRYAGKDLIDCLLSKGFDIYVVNYNLNSQSIKNNAAVFQSATRYISGLHGGKLVAATGMSMGGLINRYACAKAEENGNPLPISKMMTIDSPHQGANIPASFQNFIKQQMDASSPPDPYGPLLANNPAAKEMMTYNPYDPGSVVHSSFMNDLMYTNGDGYPHLVETIGVSFSTTAANPNSGTWLSIILSGAPNFNQANNYYGVLSGNDLAAGSFMPPPTLDDRPATHPKFWEGVGLSLLRPISNPWVTITQTKDPTFILHTSSLDIVNGVSKFDKVIIPTATGYHDIIPAELISPIVTALIEKNVYVQNKTYNNTTRTIIAGERIFAGRNVTNTIAQGDVVINSNADIEFKAGKEIQIADGFAVNAGAEFTAIITQVQCDGSVEYQERISDSPQDGFTEPANTSDRITETTLTASGEEHTSHDLYPNPTTGTVRITNLEPGIEYSYSNTSLQGAVLQTGKLLNSNEIDLSGLPPGVYVIRIVNPVTGQHMIFKVTKM